MPPSRRVVRARPAPVRDDRRARLVRALARRAATERLLLALVLVERMTPREVACTLGLAPREVERHVEILLAELERAVTPAAAARELPIARGETRQAA
jgi:DNA-directed RNA polymerase specialized sigma24 family protein